MAYIDFNEVCKVYGEGAGEVRALDGATFSVERGELAVILGASGAGKTTALNILGGMDTATSGTVTVDGRDISHAREDELVEYRRRDVGFVFQFYNLVPNLTALENVELASQICPDSLDPVETLEKVGLGERMGNFPAQLSGGEQQRVSIARALANKPEILLCDEATSALDLETTEGILALLQRINRELGITIVFITHQLDVAKQIFDRVAVMENGVVVEQGDTFDVFSSPKHPTTKALVERYLGIQVPTQLVPSLPAGTIVELRYKGDAALEPLISRVAQEHGVSIDVLHANVEYFGSQAIGILIVLVSGEKPRLSQALDDLRTHVFSYRELDRTKLAAAVETNGDDEQEK